MDPTTCAPSHRFENSLLQGDEALADTGRTATATYNDKDEEFLSGRTSEQFGSTKERDSHRVLNRLQTVVIFITNEIGLGILSLPYALLELGLIPGLIAIVGLGFLTGYTAFLLHQFYQKYPHIANIADCGNIIGGAWFGILIGTFFIVNLNLISASAILTMSIAFNSITSHALCTVAFIAFSAIACWVLCIPRSLKFVAQVGYLSTVCIIAAVLMVMIAIGIEGPQAAPQNFTKNIVLVAHPSYTQGMVACLNIAFAYAGNQGFITVMAEMKNPAKDFVPSLCYLQSFAITIYSIVAVTIYLLSAQYTHSVALGAAPDLIAKIAYGIVFPCLLGTGLVFGHTANKYLSIICLRRLGAEEEINTNSRRSWIVWMANNTVFWIIAFVLANSIPVFSSILSVASAVFVSWFTFGLPGIIWLHLNWKTQFVGRKQVVLAVVNWGVIGIALLMNTGGLYAAINELLRVFNASGSRVDGPFSCGDNGMF